MKIYKICFLSAKILAFAFIFSLIRDAFQYNSNLNSAPFYVFVLGNALVTLLPALIMYAVAKFLKSKDI